MKNELRVKPLWLKKTQDATYCAFIALWFQKPWCRPKFSRQHIYFQGYIKVVFVIKITKIIFFVIFSQSFQVSYLERMKEKYFHSIALTLVSPKNNLH